jgi:hypothetical protein
VSAEDAFALERLLEVPESKRRSVLDAWRHAERSGSGRCRPGG